MSKWLLALVLSLGCAQEVPPTQPSASRTENTVAVGLSIIPIICDDCRYDMITPQTMPTLFNAFDSALVFTHADANTALCCPSRATMWKSQDQHRTKVWANGYASGLKNFVDDNTVFTAIKTANPNIITGIFGKWLNDNGLRSKKTIAGVDEMRVSKLIANTFPMDYYNYSQYERNWNGGPVQTISYGSTVNDYQPMQLANELSQFITKMSTGTKRQFVAFYTPLSGHGPFTALPQDQGRCDWLPAATYTAELPGQPWVISRQPPPTAAQLAKADTTQRKACESLGSLDRAIALIVASLKANGRDGDTCLLFTSDHGFHFSDHFFNRKATPYRGDTDIPFMLRCPGMLPIVDSTHFGQILDIGPTVCRVVGCVMPNAVGHSLLPPDVGVSEALLEYQNKNSGLDETFFAIQTITGYKYIDFGAGPDALYDLNTDPNERVNLINNSAYTSVLMNLKSRLAILKVR